MLLLSLDFETTGLDPNSDRVIEVGAVLYTTSYDQQLMTQGYLVDHEVPISAEITKITGIRKGMIDTFGLSSKTGLTMLLNMVDLCDAVVGQNIIDFDIPFAKNWCLREKEEWPERLLIDTKTDLPGVESKHLGYMAADAGFLNPFPHRAVSDCMTVLKLVSAHNIDDVVALAKSPRVTIAASVNFQNNHLAKQLKYRWSPERKIWYKVIKEVDYEKELKAAAGVSVDIRRVEPVGFH